MQLDWMPKTEAPLAQMKEWTYPYTKYLGQYDVTLDADSDAELQTITLRSSGARHCHSFFWQNRMKNLSDHGVVQKAEKSTGI